MCEIIFQYFSCLVLRYSNVVVITVVIISPNDLLYSQYSHVSTVFTQLNMTLKLSVLIFNQSIACVWN